MQKPMPTDTSRSQATSLLDRARLVMPGGVNSPVRAFGAVGGCPVFAKRAKGSRIWTDDGRELIDFCGSWGPLILGHAQNDVVAAIRRTAEAGTSFGINTEREVVFAETVLSMMPHAEMIRLVSSGTEAVMSALRLARGYTGRTRIVKFDGCYHGHSDAMLVSAGSGLLTHGIASSAGVPPGVTGDVSVLPYNDLEAVDRLFEHEGDSIAAVIVEPLAGNMGLVSPVAGFLEGLRHATARHGALLVFDEVITGFRFAPTTYSTLAGVRPDIFCLGKIIGGGLPLGAVAGRMSVMKKFAPLGSVYQAGTLSGNPVAIAAGQTTLDQLVQTNPYPRLDAMGIRLAEALNEVARKTGLPFHCACKGSVFTPFFTVSPIRNLTDARTADTAAFGTFFQGMLQAGIYLPPAQFELGFISAAHSHNDITSFIAAARHVLNHMADAKNRD